LALTAGAVLAACWRGTPASPEEPVSNHASAPVAVPGDLEVTFSRTACLGRCPVYTVTVHRDGTVDWMGIENVAVSGKARGRLERTGLSQLAVALDAAHFFERKPDGRMPPPPCDDHNGTVLCLSSISVCSDASHFTIRAVRDGKPHEIDDAGCDADDELRQLEHLLGEIVGTGAWIGR
jgi:Domain of unknown function (DUF6438)